MNCLSRRLRRARAFTAIEILLAMGILALVLTLAISEFALVVRHFHKTSTDLDAERSARNIMARVQKELRQATPPLSPGAVSTTDPCPKIVIPQATPPPGNATPGPPTPQPTAASYVTWTEADDVAGSNIGSLSFDSFTIALSATPPPGHTWNNLVLTKTVAGNTTSTVLGTDVKEFAITPRSLDVFNIAITVDPPRRADMQTPRGPFRLESAIYISYYKL